MRRVISLWLPTWPTDRLHQRSGWQDEAPLVTQASDGRRRTVAAADARALALGLVPGMALAHARAMVPGLAVVEADPDGDAQALAKLAAWCLRIAPLTAAAPPDGIWIDATGSAHLHGGEAAMLASLVERIGRTGATARAAIADTPGAAHAVARHAGATYSVTRHAGATYSVTRHASAATTVVPPGGTAAALAELPIAGLRLPDEMLTGLHQLGLERIGQLAAVPRAPLARRFGKLPGLRLDQALGRVAEPIRPVFPEELISHRLAFAEPLLTAEAFALVIGELVRAVCVHLEETGQGARRLDLVFERVDGTLQTVSIGTARPVRGDRHLARLLDEKIETVDPGLGVEAMRLLVPLAEPLAYTQAATGGDAAAADIAVLVDRIENRLGLGRVYRPAAVESDVPERSVRHVPVLAPPTGAAWPEDLPRPVRLLDPPQPVEAMALLPDQPPVAFTWRGRRHRIRQADGPERIFGEWWRRPAETSAVRDYFAVEDEDGRRFWLFRRGDGADPDTGDLHWFLHGVF